MQTKTYTTIDRDSMGWPSGEWDGEPDKVQWQDSATGLPCLAVRNPLLGHWCGYVGVSGHHPMHGLEYRDVDIYAHGGVTYSDACQPTEDESTGICHAPDDGEPDHVWWFGFDCAHCFDWSPQQAKNERGRGYPFTKVGSESYKTLAYVQQQCAELASQLTR